MNVFVSILLSKNKTTSGSVKKYYLLYLSFFSFLDVSIIWRNDQATVTVALPPSWWVFRTHITSELHFISNGSFGLLIHRASYCPNERRRLVQFADKAFCEVVVSACLYISFACNSLDLPVMNVLTLSCPMTCKTCIWTFSLACWRASSNSVRTIFSPLSFRRGLKILFSYFWGFHEACEPSSGQ